MIQTGIEENSTKRRWWILALTLLAGVVIVGIAIAPMIEHGYPIAHSTQFNLSWLFQYQRQFFGGQFYPKWLEFSNFGFGNATFVFYPPICMVATLPFRLLGLNMPTSLVASMGWAAIVLGWGAYRYARCFYPVWLALAVAEFSILSPYLLLDLYHRGAIGEVWAIAFIPWILFTTHQTIQNPEHKKNLLWLAVSYGLLVLSHLPTLMLFSLIWWLMPILIKPSSSTIEVKPEDLSSSWWIRFKDNSHIQSIGRCYLGFLLALGWTGFFIVPVLLDQRLIQLQALTETPEYQAQHRLMLDGLLSFHPQLPTHWFETGSGLIPFWWLVLGIYGLAIVSNIWNSLNGVNSNRTVLFWLIVSGIAILMMTDLLGWIYGLLPFMQRIQFSWRWFSIITVTLPLLSASIFWRSPNQASIPKQSLFKKILAAGIAIAHISLLIGMLWLAQDVLQRAYFNPAEINRFNDLAEQKQFPFEPNTEKPGEPILFNWHWVYPEGLALGDVAEYRAKGVMLALPPQNRNYPIVLLDQGDADKIKIPKWKYGDRQIFVDSPNGDQPYKLELRMLYYPGWQVQIDGKTVPTEMNEQGQITLFNMSPGKHQIDVYYLGTRAEWLGYLVSLSAIAISIKFLITKNPKMQANSSK